MPVKSQSVIIRAIFGGGFGTSRADSYSTSVVQSVPEMLADFSSGKYRSYWDLTAAASRAR